MLVVALKGTRNYSMQVPILTSPARANITRFSVLRGVKTTARGIGCGGDVVGR